MVFDSVSETVSQDIAAVFDKGCSFEGKMVFEGTLRISGDFKGEIFTHGTLIVDEGAHVEARIEADRVIVRGTVIGDIVAKNRVLMQPPAVFKGAVSTLSLSIEEGVVFEGYSQMS